MSAIRRKLALAQAVALALMLGACGGDSGPDCARNPAAAGCPPPPTPAATITATGAGALVLHPSLNPAFAVAMETPIRVTETNGGTADWNFARMQIFLAGQEIERVELGSSQIVAAGFNTIGANSNSVYSVLFRFNSSNFDQIDITLGFGDKKDGRQFTVLVPFGSFTDVNVGLTPLKHRYSPDPL
jgi:hypothetical protein